jgi:hypothetical protein
MSFSMRVAAPRSGTAMDHRSVTGVRAAVYRAPVPALCAAMRASRSFVIPVYIVPSAHSTM